MVVRNKKWSFRLKIHFWSEGSLEVPPRRTFLGILQTAFWQDLLADFKMIRPCRFRRHRKILKAQWLPILHFVTFGMNGKLKRAKGGWRRVEEGERKRGWRKRKEENGVQAHKRAEIILDHKGWNSIENLGYSKNCQSIVEKGKRPEWTRRWSRGSGSKFSQLDLRRKE